jgi:stringent starvation protein B
MFKARFGGVSREIEIPVENVSAIYARENGQGMAFEVKRGEGEGDGKKSSAPSAKVTPAKATPLTAVTPASGDDPDHGGDEPPPKNGGRPRLTRIK